MSASGSINQPSGRSTEELTEVAVAAFARTWGVSEAEARAAIERAHHREHVDIPWPRRIAAREQAPQ